MSLFSAIAGKAYQQLNGKIPGPEPTFPLGNAGLYVGVNPWEPTTKLLEEYGDMVLIWMAHKPAILLNDPKLITKVLLEGDGNWASDEGFHKTPDTCDRLRPIVTESSSFVSNGPQWNERRRTHPFSAGEFAKWLKTQVHPIRNVVNASVRTLSEKSGFWDMRGAFERMCFDTFGQMLVGESPSDALFEDFKVVSDQAEARLSAAVNLPLTFSFGFKRARANWFAGFERYLAAARERPEGADLTRSFLPTTTLDDKSFSRELANVFSAGVYSVTSSVMSCVWQLLKQPDRLAEVRGAVKAMGEDYDWDALQGCTPLRWALLEAMRLYPGAPFYSRNVCPSKSVELGGATLPPNTIILMTPVALHRNREWWGDDADEYRPSRWADKEAGNAMGSDYFFPFGRGPRECLGKHFGFAYALGALATILGHWDWKIDDSAEQLRCYFGCMVHQGLRAKVTPLGQRSD